MKEKGAWIIVPSRKMVKYFGATAGLRHMQNHKNTHIFLLFLILKYSTLFDGFCLIKKQRPLLNILKFSFNLDR